MINQHIKNAYERHWEKAATLGCQLTIYADQWYAGCTGLDMVFVPGRDFSGFDHPEFKKDVPVEFSTELSEWPKPEWFKYVTKNALYIDFIAATDETISYIDFLVLLRGNEDMVREVSRTVYRPTARRGVYTKMARTCIRFDRKSA